MTAGLFFLILLSQVNAECFIDQLSPGKRTTVHRSSSVDDYHCKILCYFSPSCVAYTFNEGLKGCALLGPVAGLSCTNPMIEQLKKKSGCPTLDATSHVNASYIQHPSIDSNLMIPIMNNTQTGKAEDIPCGVGWNAIDLLMPDMSHRVVASYYAANIAWDSQLGAWYYKDHYAERILIRAASCFSIPLADASALDASACVPLANRQTNGYGPPTAPFNRSWPCDNGRATQIVYLSQGANENSMSKNQALINCVYGSWLFLQADYFKTNQTRGIVTATCV